MARSRSSIRKSGTKRCFVISPIGHEGSDVRKRADQVLNYIIKPIVEAKHSYITTRADDIPHPGMITPQIIERLLNDDLVIADLTGNNPNVTYELAIRHMKRKHVIQIKDSSDLLPFDISDVRTISFDYRFVDSMNYCKDQISKQIVAIEKNPENVVSPITHAIDTLALQSSGDPRDTVIQQLQSEIQMIKTKLASAEPKGYHPVFVRQDEALAPFSGQVNITQGSLIPGQSQSGLIPGQSLGNVSVDLAGPPGKTLKWSFNQNDTASEEKQ